jgi:YD repeat-containing protein
MMCGTAVATESFPAGTTGYSLNPTSYENPASGPFFNSRQEACDTGVDSVSAQFGTPAYAVANENSTCFFYSVGTSTFVANFYLTHKNLYNWYRCPAYSTLSVQTLTCACKSTYVVDVSNQYCLAPPPPQQEASMCKFPIAATAVDGASTATPILPATAEKHRSETDWSDSGPGALSFTRTYRSNWAGDPTRASNPLGQVWSHNFSTKLVATPSAAPLGVAITTGEGYVRTFGKLAGATTWTSSNSVDTLTQLSSGAWTYHRADDDTTLNFNGSGKLQVAVDRNGWATAYNYDGAGQLASVTNSFGRTLAFGYNGAGQLTTVATPDGRFIAYAYDVTGRLVSSCTPTARAATSSTRTRRSPWG